MVIFDEVDRSSGDAKLETDIFDLLVLKFLDLAVQVFGSDPPLADLALYLLLELVDSSKHYLRLKILLFRVQSLLRSLHFWRTPL